MPVLNNLEELLLKSTEMEDVVRWDKYVRRREARKENTLQHSYKAALLAIIILENERRYSNIPFDSNLVLEATIIHDLGEIATGDTVYIDKTEEGDNKEYAFFKNLISGLQSHIGERLNIVYNLQNTTKKGFSDITNKIKEKYPTEIKLFDAIERLGYVIFAYRQYKELKKGEKIFVQTLRNQHQHLVNLANELPGFGKEFYNPEIQHSVEEFLKQYEGRFIEKRGE